MLLLLEEFHSKALATMRERERGEKRKIPERKILLINTPNSLHLCIWHFHFLFKLLKICRKGLYELIFYHPYRILKVKLLHHILHLPFYYMNFICKNLIPYDYHAS